jgi:cellulose synthase/poly-beta-1,6-N-acetylglucosamine synthase-like glycosyltransferase
MNLLHDGLVYLPLGVLGLIRWSCWLVRRIPAALYRPVVSDHFEAITVVVPVYQEDPELFAHAIRSWLANDVAEVILVIDVSDTDCQQVAARYPVRVVVTDVPGKRDALRRGWELARTPLVALVDSDVVWSADVARKVAMPFADPRLGGVATRQNVYNPKGFLQRVNDIYLDVRYFDENAAQSHVGQRLSCLSGRTAVYRREILQEISSDFMSETFLGVPCMSGDDKCLTRLTHQLGYGTVLQRNARVWSTFPGTWRVFVKQRLRWGRNTWRSDLRSLTSPWIRQHKFLAFTMVDKAVSSFTVLVAPVFFVIALTQKRWHVAVVLLIWWYLSRSVKLLPHLRRRPSSFLLVPPFVLLTFFMATVKIAALLTIRKQKWLTRQVSVVNGEVVRDGPAAQPAGPSPVGVGTPA